MCCYCYRWFNHIRVFLPTSARGKNYIPCLHKWAEVLDTSTLYQNVSPAQAHFVQGNGCPEWADKELPRLETLVQTILTSPSIPRQTQLQNIPIHFCPTTDAASINPVDCTCLEGLTDKWSDNKVTISKQPNWTKSATKGKALWCLAAQFFPQCTATKIVHMWLGN